MIPILWLCGPPGVGKTAIAWEVYQRLQRTGANPAYVDVDQLGICYPPPAGDPERHALKARNAAALRVNFAAAGARILIVSGVVDAKSGPDIDTLGGPPAFAVRLRADADELRKRLRQRGGTLAPPEEAVVAEANALDRSTFAGTRIDTGGLTIDACADRIIADIGTLTPTASKESDALPTAAGLGGELLWVLGTTGVGKSTVGFRAYLDVLRAGRVAAYVDVDQLGFVASDDHGLRARNLAALWRNFQMAGARHAVVVGPVSTPDEARLFEQALAGARVSWCRLRVSDAELARRISSRGRGGSWAQPGDPLRGRSPTELAAVTADAISAGHALEQRDIGLLVDIDGLAVEDAAAALLARAHWPAADGTGS